MEQLQPSSPKVIEMKYDDIVIRTEDVGEGNRSSTITVNRMTIHLIDGYKIYVEETLNKGNVEVFHYNVVNPNKQVVFKVHSEPHSEKHHQTTTEPYHIHLGDKRIPNKHYRSLDDVMIGMYSILVLNPFKQNV